MAHVWLWNLSLRKVWTMVTNCRRQIGCKGWLIVLVVVAGTLGGTAYFVRSALGVAAV